ncbi:hypothetical protein OIU83_03430 [Flavobacterium sp. LS1R49]|uniref:Uncharacterized protein n=1 Tax=Flavobacterium shii TaxID=2987687 RepID=A0A9X3C598_9FLAO|nr:hypothetical protein [Flavobacterium shii]MCV9926682.1 hypothetical protein [Flavobacterium shii]
MKNHKKQYIHILLFGLFLNIPNLYSQTNKEATINNWFDNTVGKENMGLNNGPLYQDTYKTIGDNNMYYIANKFTKGSVNYDGQMYYDVNIKYNTHKDELILNPYGESEYIAITLIRDKTDSFSINGKNFIKLNKNISSLPQLTTGYYELNTIREGFIFYTKHHKDAEKRINDFGLYYNFSENDSYFIFYKNTYYSVNSKNDILKIFPNQKKQINDFYVMNREMRKSDNNQFMVNLFKYINSSL